MVRSSVFVLFGATLLIALPAFLPAQAGAQVNFGGTSALFISANPTHPSPGSIVTLSIQSPLLDLKDSDVEWSVNGTPAGKGQSIEVTLGALGTVTNVSVSVSGQSGNDSTQLSITPTSIDLLWEADSYIPPFYQGRAVPTSGSMIRVSAIPHFVQTNGSSVPSSDIDFTWKLNGANDETQSGIGESSALFPAAILYGTDDIVVDAQTPDGTLTGETAVFVQTQDPDLVLYEDNPLFGVMYHQALGQSEIANESETSFAAVPYFADAASANDPRLVYVWSVNGSSVASDPQDPSEITISAQASGVAQMSLSVSKPSDPFFSANGSWAVSFSANSGGNNVFKSAL